jgi:hypothetical protein
MVEAQRMKLGLHVTKCRKRENALAATEAKQGLKLKS